MKTPTSNTMTANAIKKVRRARMRNQSLDRQCLEQIDRAAGFAIGVAQHDLFPRHQIALPEHHFQRNLRTQQAHARIERFMRHDGVPSLAAGREFVGRFERPRLDDSPILCQAAIEMPAEETAREGVTIASR
jgi:hypothetical protein